ncbi:hypothetical protein PQX77_005327 [Marasmius sp. AFHP31]|nr:hypothetical protein PQX77_005327 [Marasmius sp. AFHP31]
MEFGCSVILRGHWLTRIFDFDVSRAEMAGYIKTTVIVILSPGRPNPRSTQRKCSRPLFEGGVHVVRKDEVSMKFHRSFIANPSDRFLVRFKLNRYLVRREQQALNTAFVQERVLFPGPEHFRQGAVPRGMGVCTYNSKIATVFGPNNVTMVESIRQILDTKPQSRILASAPSNSVDDLIALRLAALGPNVFFRAYAPSRNKQQVPHELTPFTFRNANGHFSVPSLIGMKRFRVVVTTCISANIVSGIGIPLRTRLGKLWSLRLWSRSSLGADYWVNGCGERVCILFSALTKASRSSFVWMTASR